MTNALANRDTPQLLRGVSIQLHKQDFKIKERKAATA